MECDLNNGLAINLIAASREIVPPAKQVLQIDPTEGDPAVGNEQAFRLSLRLSAMTIAILSLSMWYGAFYVSQWMLSPHGQNASIVTADRHAGDMGKASLRQ